MIRKKGEYDMCEIRTRLLDPMKYSHMINDFKTTLNPLLTGYGWGAATREPRARAELKYTALLRSVSSIWKAATWTQEHNTSVHKYWKIPFYPSNTDTGILVNTRIKCMSHFQVPTVNITVLPNSSSTICESSTADRSDLEECSFEQKEKSNMSQMCKR